MKRILIFVSALLCLNAWSQEIPVAGQYLPVNYLFMNPAFTGSTYSPLANVSVLKQWAGFQQSPSLQMVSYSRKLGETQEYKPKEFISADRERFLDRVGVGFQVAHQQYGPSDISRVGATYSYHIRFSSMVMSLGSTFSVSRTVVDYNLLHPLNTGDPLLSNSPDAVWFPDVDLGILFYNQRFFGGASASNLLSSGNKKLTQHYAAFNALLGYRIPLNHDFTFEPSARVARMQPATVDLDITLKMLVRTYNYVGVSMSMNGNAYFMTGIKISSQLVANYMVIYNFGKFAGYNYGSHQIGLSVLLASTKKDRR